MFLDSKAGHLHTKKGDCCPPKKIPVSEPFGMKWGKGSLAPRRSLAIFFIQTTTTWQVPLTCRLCRYLPNPEGSFPNQQPPSPPPTRPPPASIAPQCTSMYVHRMHAASPLRRHLLTSHVINGRAPLGGAEGMEGRKRGGLTHLYPFLKKTRRLILCLITIYY